jgi:hypothetical protein
VSISGEMNKEYVAYIHNEILSAIRKDEVLPFETRWMAWRILC